MGATLLGDKDLEQRLTHLGRRGSKRAITAGIRASMTPIVKAMRAAINTAPLSALKGEGDHARLKREARRTIGARFGKTRKIRERHAKVGFGVGKRQKQIQAAQKGHAKRGGGGVGISAANIHWFVLGTGKRTLKEGSERGPKAGHPTGQIANVFGKVTQLAFAGSARASVEAARKKITQVIHREAKKKG
jgi:hypothetical protein